MTEDTSADNPFRVIDTEDGPTIRGRVADARHLIWDATQVGTAVITGKPAEPDGMNVLSIKGLLWEPPLGSVIQLSEPNRDGLVYRVQYQITGSSLYSLVYVDDSMREGDFRAPRTDLGIFREMA